MAIKFLSDGNIDNDLQVQSKLTVGNGSTSYSKIQNNAINLYDSGGSSKGQIFINESGSNHLLMINNGSSGGIVYFGAPTSYTQNVIIQGGYLTVGNYLDIEGSLIKMDAPGTTTAVDVIKFETTTSSSPYTGGKTLTIGDVAAGDQVETINLMTMGHTYLQISDDQIISKADELKFTGNLGSNAITQFWGLNSNGDVQKRTKAQFASDAGIVRTTTSQTIAGDKTFSGATTFTNSITQTGGGTTTLSGDLDVQGSGISLVDDITFSGSGRIQGLASPSSGTDAANKSYVDAHPSGTVTSVALSGGTGISISGSPITGSGTITVTNSAPDQTVALTGGTGISISGTYPNFTITNSSPSSGGTITGSGTANKVTKFTGASAIGNGPITFSSNDSTFAGNVTIDNSGSGDSKLTLSTSTGGDPQIVMNSDASNRSGLIMYQDNGTNIGRIEYVHNGDKLQFQAGSSTGYALQLENTVATFSGNITLSSDKKINFGASTNIEGATSGTKMILETSTDYLFRFGGSTKVSFESNGQVSFLNYGSGTFTGTATKALQVTSAGKIIEGNIGGSGTVTSVGITAGTGISVSGSPVTSSGNITVTNSAPDQTVALTGGTGISISGSYPNFTITNSSPSSGGTVTSVSATSPVTSTGGNTPTIGVDTAAVSSGSSKLATGTQIQTAINSAVSGLGSGTVTSVATGTGLTGGTITTSGTLSLNLNGLTTTTGAGSADFFAIVNSAGSQFKIAPGNVNISTFNNNAGYVTSSGVTSVATGSGLTGGTITGSGTVSVDYGTAGLINDAPGGSGNPDQDDLVLIGKDSSGSGETRSYALVDLPFAPSGTVSGVTSVAVSGGTGISISGSPITSTGTITVTNSAPDQTVALTAGTGISVSGTYPNFTITNSSPSSGGTMSSWSLQGDSGGSTAITNGETVDIAGGTNITTSRSSNTITINNGITNNSQLINGAGYTTNTGTTTASNTQTFTNKSGNISQWTNDVGYVTSSGGSMSTWKLTADSGGTATIDDAETVDIAGGTNITTARSGNTVTINNGLVNNSQLSNTAGYITGSTVFSAGGGDVTGSAALNQSVVLTMATVNSNVGSFTNANITVDGKGRITAASSGSSGITGLGTANFLSKFGTSSTITNSEISDTGSVIQLGLDASNNSTLYLDTVNRKVGFRTTSPGAAFDVNGTMRVRNQLNVGDTTEQNLYVDGNANPGGKYVKMGNYGGATGNYFGITSSENQPKYSAAFGNGGKIVQDKRIVTVKIAASALNSATSDNGKIIISNPGTNSVLWPTNIFIYRGSGQPGSGWASGNTAGAVFYFCPSGNCGQRRIITVMAGGVCSTASEWYWGRPVPLPTINENPTVVWDGLKNQALRFRTSTTVSNATMDWYVRIEYLKINVTAGFVNNVDTTVT